MEKKDKSIRNDEFQDEDEDQRICRSNSSVNNDNTSSSSPPSSTCGSSSSGSESDDAEFGSGSDASTTHATSERHIHPPLLYATIDSLTDGSEYTGTGCGTLFLSIWKSERPYGHGNENTPERGGGGGTEEGEENRSRPRDHDQHQTLPLARYGLSGLGDGFGRLCADQRFKISPIRAVFLPSFQNSNNNNNQVDGIPSLLLALISAGSPSLHVVIPPDWNSQGSNKDDRSRNKKSDSFEELSTLVLGRHRHFDIRTCHIPTTDASSSAAATAWWKVYSDEYLEVHCGTIVLTINRTSSSSTRSFTILSSTTTTKTRKESVLVYLFSYSNFSKFRKDKTTRAKESLKSSSSAPSQSPSSFALQHYSTLLVVPPSFHHDEIEQILTTVQHQELPILPDGLQMTIDHTIALGLQNDAGSAMDTQNENDLQATSNTKSPKTPPQRNTKRMNVFATMFFPSSNNSDDGDKVNEVSADPGILIRSQQVARYFNCHMPWAFPFQPSGLSLVSPPPPPMSYNILDSNLSRPSPPCATAFHDPSSILSIQRLVSGTSVQLTRNSLVPRETETNVIIDRRLNFLNGSLRDEWKSSLESLQSFVSILCHQQSHQTPERQSLVEDENEIEIDSDSEESTGEPKDDYTGEENRREPEDLRHELQQKSLHDESSHSFDKRRPHLICLGTNCATPSAYRGSSSYALVLPIPSATQPSPKYLPIDDDGHKSSLSVEMYILDCGEGTATMLSRCCGSEIDDWKRRIKGIWISHAHLDHYGGVPTLLRLLHSEREAAIAQIESEQKQQQQKHQCREWDHHATKRLRYGYDINEVPTIPWVMAPAKVLHFIDILLQCRHGRCLTNDSVQYFYPRFHHDPTIPPGPWKHFENIKVQHNCCPSFGLLLGLHRDDSSILPNEEKNGDDRCNFLCYSGDTRPCFTLVQACRRVLYRRSSTIIRQRNWERLQPKETNKLFLIHEATFDDEEQDEAEKKMHSKLSDALQVANDIPASKVLLTHFSQRYVSLSMNKNDKKNQNHICDLDPEGATAIAPSSSDGISDRSTNSNNNPDNNKGNRSIPVGLAVDGLWVPI